MGERVKTILITGGAGFIGAALAHDLVAHGHAVTVLDNLSPQIHGADAPATSPLYLGIRDKVRFVRGSVTDPQAWDVVLPGQQAIVHLAAETGTGQSMYEIHRYTDVNVGGTALMLDRLARGGHDVERVVVASSRAIHGEGKYADPEGRIVYPGARRAEDMRAGRFEPLCAATGRPLTRLPTDEASAIHPTSVYGITKQNQEQMVLTVCAALGLDAVALRYQNVYGPGQSLKNPYTGILSIFSTRALNGNPIAVFEDGRESRDFVYIDDVVAATRLALTVPAAAGEAFGIGSGVATDVLTVAETLVAAYGADGAMKVPVNVTGAFRVGDIRHNLADLTKARRLLGFAPQVDFTQGIAHFAAWVRGQDVAEDHYEHSIREMQDKGLYQP